MSDLRSSARIPVLLAAAALAFGGCGDGGESGPGTLDGRVTSASSSLGAVVLVIEGTGIVRISGRGSTRAFTGTTHVETRRVALVGSGSDELTFSMEVEDVSDRPAVTVESAVDASNLEIDALGGIDVRLSTR